MNLSRPIRLWNFYSSSHWWVNLYSRPFGKDLYLKQPISKHTPGVIDLLCSVRVVHVRETTLDAVIVTGERIRSPQTFDGGPCLPDRTRQSRVSRFVPLFPQTRRVTFGLGSLKPQPSPGPDHSLGKFLVSLRYTFHVRTWPYGFGPLHSVSRAQCRVHTTPLWVFPYPCYWWVMVTRVDCRSGTKDLE